MTATATQPSDLAYPDLKLDDLCFNIDEGTYGEVCDASKWTRGQAISRYASEAGCAFTEVRCVVRYVLLFTRQDIWDGPGKDIWVDDEAWSYCAEHGTHPDLGELFKRAPSEPPTGWRPDESMACWQVCRPDHPRAQRAYMLEVKGDGRIPDTPALPRKDQS